MLRDMNFEFGLNREEVVGGKQLGFGLSFSFFRTEWCDAGTVSYKAENIIEQFCVL